jgi:hypothetical protein
VESITDRFEDRSVCQFIRLQTEGRDRLVLFLAGGHDLVKRQGVDWLFRSWDSGGSHYWMPLQPVSRGYDRHGRILDEVVLPLRSFEVLKDGLAAEFRVSGEMPFIEFVLWTLPLDSPLGEELGSVSSQECQGIYLWGSHTSCSGPRDLYGNLIRGAIYKNGWSWPPGLPWKTAYCETDAHALYVAFHSLQKATGKRIYQHLKTQLVFSVIARQGADGAWRHGLWTDELEVHYRLHCSAIHLLLADYEETEDACVGSALDRAVEYLSEQHDQLRVGRWYLHDSLERSLPAMEKSPLTFQKSSALGKSPSNMLVLNTHLDALVALRRYEEVRGRSFLENEVTAGVNATLTVLDLCPAEPLYRLVFRAIELTFLPISVARGLPLPVRALRRLARVKIIPLLPKIKRFFPRLVMPNGYVDRNLSLDEFTYAYFPINVMDLLRFQRRFGIKRVDALIDRAIEFMERVGLEKWLEDEEAAYSVGFWAEALYLDCLRRPGKGRGALAQAVMALRASGQGLPPSLLGCNAEYVSPRNQVPSLWTENDQIVVVNLSTGPDHQEFLLVNGTQSHQGIPIPHNWEKLTFLDPTDNPMSDDKIFALPPRGWVRLLSSTKPG